MKCLSIQRIFIFQSS